MVTCSKDKRGLGIKGAHELNLAFMARLGRRLLFKKEKLWVKVITSKYVRGELNMSKLVKRQHSSNAWQGIIELANIL